MNGMKLKLFFSSKIEGFDAINRERLILFANKIDEDPKEKSRDFYTPPRGEGKDQKEART